MSAPTPDPGEQQPREREVRRFLRRVEALARQLIGAKLDGSNGLWQLQIDLLQLQRDIQSSIRAEKSRPRQVRDFEHIRLLQICRLRSRQLGDTLAWLLFALDRKQLWALGGNTKVPISEVGHGWTGLEAIVLHLASEGWGFPIIHDVTDCLRIGDVTFVRMEAGKEHQYLTIEVKTRAKREIAEADGTTKTEYEVTLMSTMEFSPDGTVLSTPVSKGLDASKIPPPKSRIERQGARLAEAAFRQLARDGEVVQLPGGPHVSIGFESRAKRHWRELRRIIRQSRKSGYAGVCVDKALFYAAFYKKGGVTESILNDAQLVDDLKQSEFFIPNQSTENSMIVTQVPTQDEDRTRQNHLPFYLFSVPKRAISEIIRGELMLLTLTNPGRILEFLNDAGHDAYLTSPDLGADSLFVRQTFEDDAGQSWSIETRGLEFYVDLMIHEFRSIDYLGEVVDSMLSVSKRNFLEQRSRLPTPGPDQRVP